MAVCSNHCTSQSPEPASLLRLSSLQLRAVSALLFLSDGYHRQVWSSLLQTFPNVSLLFFSLLFFFFFFWRGLSESGVWLCTTGRSQPCGPPASDSLVLELQRCSTEGLHRLPDYVNVAHAVWTHKHIIRYPVHCTTPVLTILVPLATQTAQPCSGPCDYRCCCWVPATENSMPQLGSCHSQNHVPVYSVDDLTTIQAHECLHVWPPASHPHSRAICDNVLALPNFFLLRHAVTAKLFPATSMPLFIKHTPSNKIFPNITVSWTVIVHTDLVQMGASNPQEKCPHSCLIRALLPNTP